MSEELKPCPFCGGEAELDANCNDNFSYFCDGNSVVVCGTCGAHGEFLSCEGKYDKESGEHLISRSISSWNTRALTPKQQHADEMYKFLDDLARGRGTDYPIEKLLSKARGEAS